MRKVPHTNRLTFYKDLFYGLILFAGTGFVIGDVIVGGAAWLIHGLLTGNFGTTIYIRCYFGYVFAAISVILWPIFFLVLNLAKKKKSVIIGMTGFSLVLLIGSLLWGVYNYEAITLKVKYIEESFMAEYPSLYFLVGLIVLSSAYYFLWKRYKKGDSTVLGASIHLYFILYGLMLFIGILGLISVVFK